MSNCKHLTEDMLNILNAMKNLNFEGTKTRSSARIEARTKLRTYISDDVTLRAVLQNIEGNKKGTMSWMCNLDALLKNFNHIASFIPEHLQNRKYTGPVLFIGGQRSDFIP